MPMVIIDLIIITSDNLVRFRDVKSKQVNCLGLLDQTFNASFDWHGRHVSINE